MTADGCHKQGCVRVRHQARHVQDGPDGQLRQSDGLLGEGRQRRSRRQCDRQRARVGQAVEFAHLMNGLALKYDVLVVIPNFHGWALPPPSCPTAAHEPRRSLHELLIENLLTDIVEGYPSIMNDPPHALRLEGKIPLFGAL